jgi:hypothetical protein
LKNKWSIDKKNLAKPLRVVIVKNINLGMGGALIAMHIPRKGVYIHIIVAAYSRKSICDLN